MRHVGNILKAMKLIHVSSIKSYPEYAFIWLTSSHGHLTKLPVLDR